jgi:HEPN domain-containing protein
MATSLDNARGLLKKAENDLFTAQTVLATGRALDSVCFHAQQAVEKSLKAALAARDIQYPWTHNLQQLTALVKPLLPSIQSLESSIAELTPYAVGLRYDPDFEPSADDAERAVSTAEDVFGLVERFLS